MVFNQGLGGPKEKPRGLSDGQWVNIPTLEYVSKKLRNVVALADNWISAPSHQWPGKFGIYPENQSEHVAEKRLFRRGVFNPYRKPTQVDKRKYAKVNG